MIKLISIFILLIASTNSAFSFTGIPDMETTRLKTQAGAGVGGILLNESAILNPASIVFLKESSIYYQKDNNELEEEGEDRSRKFKNSQNEMVIITDNSSSVKGGVSYQYQNTEQGKRTRYSINLASAYDKTSSLGISIKHSNEDSYLLSESYTQVLLGYTKNFTSKFSAGFTINDPGQVQDDYFKYTVGVQYTINQFFLVLADFGSGDVENYEDHSFTKVALQLNTFQRWFLRYGRFHDKMLNQNGVGFGLSWVGPKFSLDYAFKNYEQIEEKADIIFPDETVKEASIGLTILI